MDSQWSVTGVRGVGWKAIFAGIITLIAASHIATARADDDTKTFQVGDVTVTFKVQSAWYSYSQLIGTVSGAESGWTMKINFPDDQTISSAWGIGTLNSSAANTVYNNSWSAADGDFTFGLTGQPTGALPESIVFNGESPGGNSAPDAANDTATVEAGQSVTIDVLDNDSDSNGDTLTVSEVSTPTQGAAEISNNQIVYTANSDASGTDSFTYTVSDGQGGSDSATVTVTIQGQSAPTIQITTPNDNQVFSQETLAPITITVSASDSDGTVEKTEITVDGQTFEGTSASWTPSAFGTFTITATATDDDSLTATDSISVTVQETENQAPTVTFVTPGNGDVISQETLSSVSISVSVSDSDGSVASSAIQVDGQTFSGTSASWTPSAFGTYTITATATDDDGETTTQSISVTIQQQEDENEAPTVTFVTPSDGETIKQDALSAIDISVTASNSDGSVAGVTISVDDQSFDSTSASWTPSAFGTYTISATATDDDGATTTASVSVTIKKNSSSTTRKQVIGYVPQWDGWKSSSIEGVPAQVALSQGSIDPSKYTILNFAFLGVANDGTLHSGDFRNKQIYADGQEQEPADMFYLDPYSSFDFSVLWGEVDIINWVSEGSDLETRLTELGYTWDNSTSTWENEDWGISGEYPIVAPKEDGVPGLFDIAKENDIKLLASIGGWSMCKHFPEMAADEDMKANFIADCKKLINIGFDGIDLDWEYPGPFSGMNFTGSDADFANFTSLVKDLREAIGDDKLITSCFSCSPTKLVGFEWEEIDKYIDYFNIMSYDINGGWSDYTGHNSPLYADEGELSWDNAFKYLTEDLGVAPEKINMGMGFYGRSVVTDGDAYLGAPTYKTSKTFDVDGTVTSAADFDNFADFEGTPYYFNLALTTTDWTEYWDDTAKVPYKTNGKYFLSYDNEESIEAKANYVMENNAAGVIIWETYSDWDFSDATLVNGSVSGKATEYENVKTPLLDVVHAVFNDGDVNQAPTLTIDEPEDDSVITQETLSAVTISVTASDSDGTVASVQIEVDDQTFDGSSASWTPSAYGEYTITATATDDQGASTTKSVTVTISDGQVEAPVANDDAVTTSENEAVTISPLDNDTGTSVSLQTIGTPSHGTAVISGDNVTYTPETDHTGTDSFTYTIVNSEGQTASATITVTVKEAEVEAPVANDDTATTSENEAVTISPLDNDTGTDISLQAVGTPSNGAAVISGDTITYTPETDHTGTDSFTYTIVDSEGQTASATITVTVEEANADEKVFVFGDVKVVFTVKTAWYSSYQLTGVVTGADEGWTMNVEFANGQTIESAWGIASATSSGDDYNVYNNSWSDGSGEFTLSVSGTPTGAFPSSVTFNGASGDNNAPSASADTAEVYAGASVTIDVLSNDSDADGDDLTIESVATPSQGSVSISNDQIVYVADDDAEGTDSFTYLISDGNDGEATGTVTVTIIQGNAAPTITFTTPTNGAVITQEALSAIAIQATAEDSDGEIVASSLTVDGETIDGLSASWTPSAFGSYTITASATDDEGAVTEKSVTVTVAEEGTITASVPGWPSYIAMGAVTITDESDHPDDSPVDAIFKYAGDGGNGDRGSIVYPIYTKKTIELAQTLTETYDQNVMPVMVVYTAEMSGGTNFEDLHDTDNLTMHFVNLIHTCQIMQSYKTDDFPYPGSIVLNPDLLGMVQQQSLMTQLDATTIEVQEALSRAIHCALDEFDYDGESLTSLGIFNAMRSADNVYSDWDVKTTWEDYITDSVLPYCSSESVDGIPEFDNDFRGWIQATNFVINYFAPDVTFGWQENVWSNSSANWVHEDYAEGEINEQYAAPTAELWNDLGVYNGEYKPDFLVFDKYEMDVISGDWLFNARDWDNYLTYVKYVNEGLGGVPVMLWQIPGGHLQTEDDVDERTSHASTAPDYFFGDSNLEEDLSNLKSYITSSTIEYLLEDGYDWRTSSNMAKAKDSNVFSILWGGGNTTSVGLFPYDDGGWLSSKVNAYYENPTYLTD